MIMPKLHKKNYFKSLQEINTNLTGCLKTLPSIKYIDFFIDAKCHLEGSPLLDQQQRDEYHDVHWQNFDYSSITLNVLKNANCVRAPNSSKDFLKKDSGKGGWGPVKHAEFSQSGTAFAGSPKVVARQIPAR